MRGEKGTSQHERRGRGAAGEVERTPLDKLLADLFTNVLGEEAERLVLMGKGKKDLGGWGRPALRAAILRVFPELEQKQ